MKKLSAITLAFLLVLSLSGCSAAARDYQRGLAAMKAFDYESAKSCFEPIDYKDSKELYLECSFLRDIEKSVIDRCENANNAPDTAHIEDFINQEIAQIEGYSGKLRQGEIQRLFNAYYQGLQDQLLYCRSATLDNEVINVEGMTARYMVINELYNGYGLFGGNEDVYHAYIEGREAQEYYAETVKAAAQSINAWRENMGPPQFGADSVKLPDYQNNTDYTFCLVIAVTPIDAKGVKYETLYHTFEGIRPGDTINLELPLGNTDTASCELEFEVYDYL